MQDTRMPCRSVLSEIVKTQIAEVISMAIELTNWSNKPVNRVVLRP